jgi:hypothetical protein
MNKVQYLVYIVDENEVHVDPSKIQVICDWPTPTTLTELRSFLGLANFYRQSVLGFSHIAWALIQVTKVGGRKNSTWGKEQQRAFDGLKHCLCLALVLSLPDLQQLFKIETDASDYVVAAVLTQHGHPVAYHSETLSDIVQKYPTYEKEMYSIVQACRQWKHYIMGKETIIHIDHKPLQFIQTQGKLENDRHQKWSTYLQQFHLNIKYKTQSTNRVIDCFSRPPMVIDRFSKMSILTTYKKNISVADNSKLFFEQVWVHFGIPQTIISDRDNRFLNRFWLSLWSLLDTKLTKSTASHPQIDDQTKVVNHMSVHILHMYNSKRLRTWD